MSSFKTLFEVKFFHKYYDGYKSNDFQISLMPATRELLSGYSLLYRTTAEGFLVLFNEERKFLLESIREKLTMSFGIRSINPHFETFTNIHPINKRVRYFFNNEHGVPSDDSDRKSNDEESYIRLHTSSFVDQTNLFQYGFPHSNVKDVVDASEIVVDREGQILFDGVLTGSEHFAGLVQGTLGWYDISFKGLGKKIRFNLLTDLFQRSFAVIDISFGGSSSIGFEQLRGAKYQINFDNRPVLWTYYFVSDVGKYYEQVTVYSGKELLSFSSPVHVKLANGQAATKITSLISFPLQQRFSGKQVHAELLEKLNGTENSNPKFKINLSTPNETRIKGRREGEMEVYFSEIYVYV